MRGSSQPLTMTFLAPAAAACACSCTVYVRFEPRELDLARRDRSPSCVDEPVVERAVVLELERADRVGDALDRVRLAVRPVVHRVDAPGVAGAVVAARAGCGTSPGRAGSCCPPPCRSCARSDFAPSGNSPARMRAKQVEVLLDGAIAVGAVAPGLGQGAAVLADLLRGQVVDVGLAVARSAARPTRRAARSSRRRRTRRSSQSKPSQRTSSLIESTYSCSSLVGLVSSKRRLHVPPYSSARPKLRQIDLAWPMCR